MLIHPTIERLRALGLTAMADTLIELQNNPQAAEMPHADWLGLLIDHEVTGDWREPILMPLGLDKIREDRFLAQCFACLKPMQTVH